MQSHMFDSFTSGTWESKEGRGGGHMTCDCPPPTLATVGLLAMPRISSPCARLLRRLLLSESSASEVPAPTPSVPAFASPPTPGGSTVLVRGTDNLRGAGFSEYRPSL